MEAALALVGALLFGIAAGASNSGALFASLIRDGRWSLQLRGTMFFGFYVLGGFAAIPFLDVFKDLWRSVGVVSAPGGISGLFLAIALWTAAVTLLAGALLKRPLSAWHLLLAGHLGVGIAHFWGYAHVDRFAVHFGLAVVFGPTLAFLTAGVIRLVMARITSATHFHIYAGARPLTVIPKGDNPMTSMMAMQALAHAQQLPADLREQTHYRPKSSGKPTHLVLGGFRDVGLVLHLLMRGLWDVGVVALALSMSVAMSDTAVTTLAVCTVMLGVVLMRGHGSGDIVALSGSVSKEASLASQWASALTLPIGAWFGIFFATNQVTCAAFSGAGILRTPGLQRILSLVMVWVAAVSLTCALSGLTLYLYLRLSGS